MLAFVTTLLMKYLIRILSAVIVTTFASCSDNKAHNLWVPNGTVRYSFPGYSGIRYSGTITHNGEDLLYFVNTAVSKKIDFFHSTGKKFTSVSLLPITSSGETIEAVLCISPDTIFVKTAMNGHIYCMNQKGFIWKRINCPDTWDTGEKYEPTATIANNNFYLDHKFIFHCIPAFPTNENLSLPAALNEQAALANKKPYFLTIENWQEDSISYKFSIPGFYVKFIDSGYINMEPPLYACSDENILIFSVYSDKIYKVAKDNSHIEKEVKISSRYTRIGIQPVSVTTEQFGQALNNMAQNGGMIINVTYDKYRKQFYVSVRHEVSAKENTGKPHPNKWSVIILDAQLNFKEEILMEAGKYNPGDIIVHKNGILVYKNSDKLLPEKTEFDVFTIEHN